MIEAGIATKTCSPAPELPWLLLRSNDCRQAFSIGQNRHSPVRNPQIFRSVAAGSFSYPNCIWSIGAWLIIAAEHHLNNNTRVVNFFLNPISGARVMLPSQSTIQCHFNLQRSLFPQEIKLWHLLTQLLNRRTVRLVAGLSSDGLLYICRPTDASWSLFKLGRMFRVRNVEILDEKLYAIVQRNTGEFIALYNDE